MPPPDEHEFRRLRQTAVPQPCAFERALLARCAGCSLARPVLLAERESIGCSSAPAGERCRAYRGLLRESARFALRIDAGGPLPFAKEIRLQCGGLIGLDDSLREDVHGGAAPASAPASAPAAALADVDALLREALARYGGLEALPYSRIIRAVIRYEPRPRARR